MSYWTVLDQYVYETFTDQVIPPAFTNWHKTSVSREC